MSAAVSHARNGGLPEPGADQTRKRIMEAAVALFSAQGYTRATTRAIAAAADVNEVTLFRHFGSKQNLLIAVIAEYTPVREMRAILDEEPAGDYGQHMLHLGCLLFQVMRQRANVMRLMLSEADHLPELRDIMVNIPRQLRRLIADYIRGQMDQGRVRPLQPEAAAQAFLGMFVNYGMYQSIFAEPLSPEIDHELVIQQFVDVFVQGTVARGG